MRLKTFYGQTIIEAMARVRQTLGAEALIVSTQQHADHVRVIVAIDSEEGQALPLESGAPEITSAFEDCLRTHRLPEKMLQKLGVSAKSLKGSLLEKLGRVFAHHLQFEPFDFTDASPVVLIGPPGAGKSLALAKIAAQSLCFNRSVHLITTDRRKAGAIEQMTKFADALQITLSVIENPLLLGHEIQKCGAHQKVLIDTGGINPFCDQDLSRLHGFLQEIPCQPLLVMPAGGDVEEVSDMARAFAPFGGQQVLITKLDLARRLGSIFGLIQGAPYKIVGFGEGPTVAQLLHPASSVYLARLVHEKYQALKPCLQNDNVSYQ